MTEEKNKLEKRVKQGLYGNPQIKKEEKNRFLGEFKERVLRYLDFDQVMEEGTYPEIQEAIKNPLASKLIIDREIDIKRAQDYIKLAQKNSLEFKRVDSPDFKGEVALIVVAEEAVDVKKRKVINRKEKLQKIGISDTIIKNVGAKLCNKCWQELAEKAPEELINYQKINFLDKLLGTKCSECQVRN